MKRLLCLLLGHKWCVEFGCWTEYAAGSKNYRVYCERCDKKESRHA